MPINNQELIEAIVRLKTKKVVRRDGEIADKMGYSKGTLADYINEKKQVSELFLRKFYDDFPEAKIEKSSQKRTNWMVNEPKVAYGAKSNVNILNNADLKIMEAPLVNQYAYAGYLRGFGDEDFLENLPKIPWLVNKEYKGNYMAFEVRGDSMDDNSRESYIEGDMLLCREIGHDKWSQSKLHIKKWDFVIVHKTEGILVKRILDHNVNTGVIRLHSLNDFYEDFDVNLKDVAQIFNVVQVIRKK